MKIKIGDYKNLVKIISPKTIPIDLPIKTNEKINHDIDFVVNLNNILGEYTIKIKICQLFVKYGHKYNNMKEKIKKIIIIYNQPYCIKCLMITKSRI